MEQDQVKKLISLFYEIGSLRKIPRSHQQTLLFQDLSDNIASHSFRVIFIGYFLAKSLSADANKVMKMCLLHDMEETRTGDQNWVHKKYVKSFEDEVRKEQLANLENVDELRLLSEEYDERKTLESKIAKDADLLDQILLLREYEWQGSQEAKKWLGHEGLENEQQKLLFTELGRNLAEEIKKQEPSAWWENSWSSKRR